MHCRQLALQLYYDCAILYVYVILYTLNIDYENEKKCSEQWTVHDKQQEKYSPICNYSNPTLACQITDNPTTEHCTAKAKL